MYQLETRIAATLAAGGTDSGWEKSNFPVANHFLTDGIPCSPSHNIICSLLLWSDLG